MVLRNRDKLIVDGRGRVRCPVCGNLVRVLIGEPGDDVTESVFPNHSEGLIGSGRQCYAVGLLGYEAQQIGADPDPALARRAHP